LEGIHALFVKVWDGIPGYWILDTRCRMQDSGYKIQDTGYRIHKVRCRIHDS